MLDIWTTTLYGNSIGRWAMALGAFVGLYLFLLLVKRLLARRLDALAARTPWQINNVLVSMVRSTHGLFLLVMGLELGAGLLDLPENVDLFFGRLLVTILLLQAAVWALSILDYLITRRLLAGQPENEARTTRSAIMLVVKIGVWSMVVLLVLQNVTGIKVDALIASLGIAGVAVALAVQNILGDLFSSLSIALDRPFVIGDVIKVGTMIGTVEKIGLKSTRLRSIDGEQLIFSNADLLSSRIQNFQRMERRRALLTLGVDYSTPVEKLEAVPGMLAEIITALPQVTFERAHLKTLGDFAILYEVVYMVESSDFSLFMDRQQVVALEILRRFEKEGIRMPVPTQNLLIQRLPDERPGV